MILLHKLERFAVERDACPVADARHEAELAALEVAVRVSEQTLGAELPEHRREQRPGVPTAGHHDGMSPRTREASPDGVAERAPRPRDGIAIRAVGVAAARPEPARLAQRQATAGLPAEDLSRQEAADVRELRPAAERRIPLDHLEDAEQVRRCPEEPRQRPKPAAENEPAAHDRVIERERAGPLRRQVPRARAWIDGDHVSLARRVELEVAGAPSIERRGARSEPGRERVDRQLAVYRDVLARGRDVEGRARSEGMPAEHPAAHAHGLARPVGRREVRAERRTDVGRDAGAAEDSGHGLGPEAAYST